MKNLNRGETFLITAFPDVIFILLFFLIAATLTKKYGDKLTNKISIAGPKIQAIEDSTNHITMKVTIEKNGINPSIRIDGNLIEIKDIVSFIMREKEKLSSSNRDQIIILLKANENVSMGIVTDVTQELRKANARNIVYRANWKKDSNP